MRATLRRGASVLLVAGITFAGLEAGLRLAPGLIPEALLRSFDKSLRGQIAQRRFLPHESQSLVVPRDDEGPPLKVLKPFAEVAYHHDDTGARGVLAMDGLGFRNVPADIWQKPRVDIVTVGDSFTIPTPPHLERAWSFRLGRRLGRSVYVAARGSLGPYEYVQLLRHFGLAKRPDLVVMQIYGGNDLRDALQYWRWRGAGPDERRWLVPERSRNVRVQAWLDNPLGRHSYAWNTLVVATALGSLELRTVLVPGRRIDFRYRIRFPDGQTVEMNVGNGDLDEVRNARRLRAGGSRLEVFDAALERYAELARGHGFLPVLSYAPSAYSAYRDFVEFRDPSVGEAVQWLCDQQRAHLRRRADHLGLRFVDLTPALRQAARELGPQDLLYGPVTVHFADAGERVVADALARALKEWNARGDGAEAADVE